MSFNHIINGEMIYYFTSRAYVIICGRIFVRVCFGFFRILCFIWIRMTKNVSSLLSPQIFSTLFIKRCDQSQTDSPWAEVLFPETFLLWYIVPVLWQRLGKLKSKKEKINYWVFIVGLSIRENWEGICCWKSENLIQLVNLCSAAGRKKQNFYILWDQL